MAWEKRRNGKKYFYLSRRLSDGRVRKKYFGKGHSAEVESSRLVFKYFFRWQEKKQREHFSAIEAMSNECMASIETLFEAQMYAAGFHNPKSRGWRKIRRDKMIRTTETNNFKETAEDTRKHEQPNEEEVSLEEVIHRCRAGDQDARMTLRRVIKEQPDLFTRFGHITAKVQAEWNCAINGPDLFEREVMGTRTRELRKGLIEEGSETYLEQLAIDQVVISHLEQGFHNLIEAKCVGKGIEIAKYQIDASQRSYRRYEKALATLTTIRALTPKLVKSVELVIEKTDEKPKENQISLDTSVTENRLTGFFKEQPYPMEA